MKFCISCGVRMAQPQRFCTSCGAEVAVLDIPVEPPPAEPPPPAGWYPDPDSAGWIRWWDGGEWGEATQADPTAGSSMSVARPGRTGNRTALLVAATCLLLVVAGVVLYAVMRHPDSGASTLPTPTGSPTGRTPTTRTPVPTSTPPAQVTNVAAEAAISAPPSSADAEDASRARVSFGTDHLADGSAVTAWRMDGDGTGRVLTFRFPSPIRVLKIGIINGYAKTDPADHTDRYLQNRRVAYATWSFDDGTSAPQQLRSTRMMQRLTLSSPTVTKVVSLRIDSVAGGTPGHDFTAISEIEIDGGQAGSPA
jgi:Protein of unknown function (DUF2510)